MTFRKINDYFLDDARSLHDRLFVLLTGVMLISWAIKLIELILLHAPLTDILELSGGIILLAAVTLLSVRADRSHLGAIIVTFGICTLYTPITFFFGGGLYGDAPLWFLFSIFFLNICLRGKARIAFLLMDIAEAVVCWYLSYRYPELIIENPPFQAHVYSLAALILTGLSMSLMIGFRNAFYEREMKRSLAQQREIEALNESQNRFFSSMSHEIRTPINTIIALNEMILRENISDEVAEDAANIQSASKMLLHLINDILDMSKFASGQMKLTPVVYHPGDMLSDIVGMLWVRAKDKKLDFQVHVSPDIPADLVGDEMRIKQILINVLNNAIKYTNEGSVSLSIQPGETENGVLNVIYSVSDTGIGIKKENIPYLFHAFKRVDETENRHIEGTGLGLSIVRQFVDMMGGKITVNSIYTKGSTFIIEIPQKVAGSKQIGEIKIENGRAADRQQSHVSGFEAPSAKVLVVDDNASNLMVVSKLLRITKVQTELVSSGEEALKCTLNEHYHVIFLDHLMPHMDGIECLKAIRNQIGGRCKESKIVALTANAGSENRLLYEREGFDGYLTKPITGEILERELYRLLPKDLTIVTGTEEDILQETISWMKREKQKKSVVITTESVADLPQEIIDRYGIAVLPHRVITEEGNFLDGIEIETKGLLEYMQDPSRSVMTGGPDVQTAEAFFAKQLTGANNIIHISISGEVTNSGYVAAAEAARAFDNVTVINSGHLSSGQGLMVIEACRLAEEGKSPEEIKAHLERMQPRIHTSFVVDNLDFLARANQVSERIAGMTKSLMARPVLVLRRGKMGVGKVYFGSRQRVWERYIRSVLRRPSEIDRRILFVTYVGINKKNMNWIREQIEKRMKFDKIYFQKASPAIAVNCGSGTFGLLIRDADRNTRP
ncbi:MAG: DegV family EDD domain-containing protein [Oscillospiraceae bacterium]|nr:DegV family EDD domain-containing protein [Oscillospiraceae bacterium]